MSRVTITACALLLALATPVLADVYETTELNYGSREQLRACLDSDDRIKEHSKRIADLIADNNAMLIEIQVEAKTLADLQSSIATNNKDQVENFNRRIEEHNRLVRMSNERAEKTKTELDAYNKELAEHNKRCASLVYKMADREAVMKERRAAGK